MRSMTEEVVSRRKPVDRRLVCGGDLSRLLRRHPPLKGRALVYSISSGFNRSLPQSRSDQMKPELTAGSSTITKRLTSTMVS